MTREEFVDQYIKRSNLEEYRTPTGFKIGARAKIALACYCGDHLCDGWAFVADDPQDIEDHKRRFGHPAT